MDVLAQRRFLDATSSLSSLRKTRFSSQPLDFAVNSPRAKVEDEVPFIGLEDNLRSRPLPVIPRHCYAHMEGGAEED
jgi:hypothetical protein